MTVEETVHRRQEDGKQEPEWKHRHFVPGTIDNRVLLEKTADGPEWTVKKSLGLIGDACGRKGVM